MCIYVEAQTHGDTHFTMIMTISLFFPPNGTFHFCNYRGVAVKMKFSVSI